MSESVSRSKLTVGLLGSADIANSILGAFTLQRDLDTSKSYYEQLQSESAKTLETAQALAKIGLKDGYSILKEALMMFPQDARILAQRSYNQLLLNASGFPISAHALSLNTKVYAQNNFTDLYGSIIFEMPENYVRERVKRFYNSMFRIGNLSATFATRLYAKSKIDKATWMKAIAEEGIPDAIAPLILDDLDAEIPLGTLMRMSQVVDVDNKTIDLMLDESMIRDTRFRTLWKNYIKANRLRDELLEYKAYLKRAHANGVINTTQLRTELLGFKATVEEVDQICDNADAEYNRTLIVREIETRTWLYRKGLYGDPETGEGAEEDFYTALAALGLQSSTVNSIVRLEAAKNSINWEQQ